MTIPVTFTDDGKNSFAVALGRLAKGHKKTLTMAERKRRAQRMALARKSRWNKTK